MNNNKRLEQVTITIGVITASALLIKATASFLNRESEENLPPLVPYKFPFIGSTFEFHKSPIQFAKATTAKFGSIFRMHFHGDVVTVVGAEDAAEVFNHPDLSFVASQSKFFVDTLFHGGNKFTLPRNTVKNSIMKNLIPNLKFYTPRAFSQFLSDAKELQDNEFEVPALLPFLRKFVSRYSASAFVGVDLCQNADLLYAFEHAATDIGKEFRPSPLRLIFPNWNSIYIRFFFSKGEAIKQHRTLIKNSLKSEIKKRSLVEQERPSDILDYLIKEYPHDIEDDDHLESLTTIILIFIFVGVHTTSEAVTYVLYTLVQHPEYVQDLRDEQDKVLLEMGISQDEKSPIYTPEMYRRMVKLDSFIHEALRFRSGAIGLPHTNIGKHPIQLKSSAIIKPGHEVFINIWHIHNDETNQSPYENLSEFNGFRYIDQEHKSITNASHDNIIFGMGKHACPGRWFAVQQIKGLISYFIRNYNLSGVGEIKTMHSTSIHVGAPQGVIKFTKRQG